MSERERKIDALVAKHVLEWYIVFPKTHQGERRIGSNVERIPHYSTDIAAAWEVVERLDSPSVAKHYGEWICTNLGSDFWYSADLDFPQFKEEFDAGRYYLGKGETAPLAICLAALRLKNIEVPE